jgi:hypothetical protein
LTRCELQVQPQRVVDTAHERRPDPAEDRAEALHRNGAHLFALRFGVDSQPAELGRQQHLKRETRAMRRKSVVGGSAGLMPSSDGCFTGSRTLG